MRGGCKPWPAAAASQLEGFIGDDGTPLASWKEKASRYIPGITFTLFTQRQSTDLTTTTHHMWFYDTQMQRTELVIGIDFGTT